MESTLIHNSIGNAYGLGHKHKCGIPQGCPLSMVFVALFLRSWVVHMLSLSVVPRTLADDLFIAAQGYKALTLFVKAYGLNTTKANPHMFL